MVVRMKLAFILVFTFGTALHAQTFVGFHAGIGNLDPLRFDGESNPHATTWNKGVSLGLFADWNLAKSLALSSTLEYNFFAFQGYVFRGASVPEISIVSSRGDNSHVYRFAIEAKLLSSTPAMFRLQFVSGIAYVMEDFGDVYTTFDDMNSPGTREREQPNNSRSYFAHSAGVGFRSNPFESVGLTVLARYHSNYRDRFQSAISAGLVFQLN